MPVRFNINVSQRQRAALPGAPEIVWRPSAARHLPRDARGEREIDGSVGLLPDYGRALLDRVIRGGILRVERAGAGSRRPAGQPIARTARAHAQPRPESAGTAAPRASRAIGFP